MNEIGYDLKIRGLFDTIPYFQARTTLDKKYFIYTTNLFLPEYIVEGDTFIKVRFNIDYV